MIFAAFVDGASRGNPGDAGYGVLFRDAKGALLSAHGGFIGRATNNEAEYRAILACLSFARSHFPARLRIHSDSELVVSQLNGSYKTRNARLKALFAQVKKTIAMLPFPVEFVHIPREENAEADALANRAIDIRRTFTEP